MHDMETGQMNHKVFRVSRWIWQYAGDGRHAQAKGHTTLRYIAVVYRAWELAALEEVQP